MAIVKEIDVPTSRGVEFVKITDKVRQVLGSSGVEDGICCVYVPHTTAGVTINEGADPDVVRDIISQLERIVPFEANYAHAEGNSAAHIKASIMGSSVSVVVRSGTLLLGTWQSIFFCEFDGPRRRKVIVRVSD
jgi:secondary thiamine-phosphate synthase enzyme